ncbi:MAG: response regulator transcription factor, partial [Bartonella sp.]|nr:response regulator transcription factor [Bartonella sp.]
LRINAILRRGSFSTQPKIEQIVFGPYIFSISRRELKKEGKIIKLTDKEQEMMVTFSKHAGDTIPRHKFAMDDKNSERSIDVQINRLRRKIENNPTTPIWIQTVRGIGYKLSIE